MKGSWPNTVIYKQSGRVCTGISSRFMSFEHRLRISSSISSSSRGSRDTGFTCTILLSCGYFPPPPPLRVFWRRETTTVNSCWSQTHTQLAFEDASVTFADQFKIITPESLFKHLCFCLLKRTHKIKFKNVWNESQRTAARWKTFVKSVSDKWRWEVLKKHKSSNLTPHTP